MTPEQRQQLERFVELQREATRERHFGEATEDREKCVAAQIAIRDLSRTVPVAELLADNERLDELLYGIPFVHDGKDLTEHFIADGTTDLMRKLASKLDGEYGRDCGAPGVVLENLADDCDLLAAHNVQLTEENRRLQAELDAIKESIVMLTGDKP